MKCLHCPKVFNRRVQLLNHLFMHSKLKPYHCATCNYANDRKGNVADHVKKVHKKEWTNNDIVIDKAELALMRKICCREADIIQGYVDTEGNKLARPVNVHLTSRNRDPDTEEPEQDQLPNRYPPLPMQ